MSVRKKIRIGDLLVRHNILTEEQLQSALKRQKKTGARIGNAMIELGFISSHQLQQFLAEQLQIPYVDLQRYKFNEEVVKLLPETYARRYRAMVLDDRPGRLLVAVADPTDIHAYDELTRILKRTISQAVVQEKDLLRAIDTVYRRTEEIVSLAEELGEELSGNAFDLADLGLEGQDEDVLVVRLLRSLFEDAVQIGASDIHIEPDERVLRVRQRIDGVLHEQVMKEKRIAGALVSRIKLMSGLDISERRLPQGGRFNIRVRGRSIDVRISTMPLQYGESVVMRLLDQSCGQLSLDQIGMPGDIRKRFISLINRSYGMVLVTGPTGSGKTTTLYAALSELNSSEKKIITVEDPVEYRLPRINQVQVHGKIGLNFAQVLRASLRQDPDIIMVGEMRDRETSEIGLRAAMTGHMVLSTLHTNDAASTALRLVDMGAEGYAVAGAVHAILGQRLVRRICESCIEDDSLEPGQTVWLKSQFGESALRHDYLRGGGCSLCNGTGYSGRIGIFELLEMDQPLGDALRRNDIAEFANGANRQKNFRPLHVCALEYAARGITTVDEVMRLSAQLGDSVVDETMGETG